MTDLSILTEGLPTPRGPLGLLSGDEFGPQVRGFDEALLAACPGRRVGLVVCADHRAGPSSARLATDHFARLGAEVVDPDLIHGADAEETPDLIYIGGGSPAELLACLRDNARWAEITAAWRAGAGLAGASAGAMGLCSHSLAPRDGDRVPTHWTQGLGPVTAVALAVHASSRPTSWLQGIAESAPVPVLALDDHTGVIVHADGRVQQHGPGAAWFM